MPLSVAGAFHTEHMAPAVEVLAGFARSVSTHDPRTPVISNRDGQVVHDGQQVLRRIVSQVANPVRWDLCMETMLDLGVTGILEMPPAGTLTGIAKRALKGVETFALKTPDQLDEARRFCDKHGSASALDTAPTWRMLVSPAKGTFRQKEGLPRAARSSRTRPSARSPASATRRRSTRPTAAPSSSGSSTTATWSPPASRWSVSTRRVWPDERLRIRGLHAHPRSRRRARPGRLPPEPGRPERRGDRGDRLQRRVDPAAVGHPSASLGGAGGDRADDGGGRVSRRSRDGRDRAGAGRLRHRRDRLAHAPDPCRGDRDRARARHRAGRGLRHLRRLRRLLPRDRARRRHGQGRHRKARRGDRGRAALRPHRPPGPGHRLHLRRRRRRRCRGPERRAGDRPGRLGLRRRAVRPDPPEGGLARRPPAGLPRRCPTS